jgi:hypothetical protein
MIYRTGRYVLLYRVEAPMGLIEMVQRLKGGAETVSESNSIFIKNYERAARFFTPE